MKLLIYFVNHYSWSQGYDGSKAAFIDKNTVCYKCGNNMKFVDEDGQEKLFGSEQEALGPCAVSTVNKVFATSDVGIEPAVNVYQYPSFDPLIELVG